MTTKYVSTARGNDSTGDGSGAAPWKTIGKAIGATPAFTLDPSNPNTLYIEPGVYRESILLGVSPTSSGPLSIVGDVDGGGFAAGGFASSVAGLVDWRAWSDDYTPITAANLDGRTKNYVNVKKIKFTFGKIADGAIYLQDNHDWTFQDCFFVCYYKTSFSVGVAIVPTAGTPANVAFDRCHFHAFADGAINYVIPLHTAEWSVNCSITNCLFTGPGSGIYYYQQFGSGTHYCGGLTVQNSTFYTGGYAIYIGGGSAGFTLPVAVNGCAILGGTLHADNAGQLVENGNIILQRGTNDAVTAGANSKFEACPAISFGDERILGIPLRAYGTPSAVSPFNGFGTYGTTPADDLTGRARPEGTGAILPAVGCLERHDTGAKNTAFQDSGSSACMALVGPASQERLLLVDAVATTVSVKVRWDGNHGDANKPRAVLVAEPQIGVAGQTITATSTGGSGATPNAYETLTFAAFTPTAKGAVTLRMISRAAAGNGTAYFDSINL